MSPKPVGLDVSGLDVGTSQSIPTCASTSRLTSTLGTLERGSGSYPALGWLVPGGTHGQAVWVSRGRGCVGSASQGICAGGISQRVAGCHDVFGGAGRGRGFQLCWGAENWDAGAGGALCWTQGRGVGAAWGSCRALQRGQSPTPRSPHAQRCPAAAAPKPILSTTTGLGTRRASSGVWHRCPQQRRARQHREVPLAIWPGQVAQQPLEGERAAVPGPAGSETYGTRPQLVWSITPLPSTPPSPPPSLFWRGITGQGCGRRVGLEAGRAGRRWAGAPGCPLPPANPALAPFPSLWAGSL